MKIDRPQQEQEAFAASLYFDDGDCPTAEYDHAGYFTTEAEADSALRAHLATLADESGHWVGYVERGTFRTEDDDPPYLPPSFETDMDWHRPPVIR